MTTEKNYSSPEHGATEVQDFNIEPELQVIQQPEQLNYNVRYDSFFRLNLQRVRPYAGLKLQPEGLLCIPEEDLINADIVELINVTMYGTYYAKQRNLTFMPPKGFFESYAVEKIQNLYPLSSHKVVLEYADGICSRNSQLYNEFPIKAMPLEALMNVSNPDFVFKRAFYEILLPRPHILDFVDRLHSTKLNDAPFASVSFTTPIEECAETMSKNGLDDKLCTPKRDYANLVFSRVMEKELPFLVWGGMNESQVALETYGYAQDVNMRKLCQGSESICSVLWLEMSARSTIFLGAKIDPWAVTIARLRAHRQLRNGILYPSILDYTPDKKIKEIYGAFFNPKYWYVKKG